MLNFYKNKIDKYNNKINLLFGGVKLSLIAPKGVLNVEDDMRRKLELKINLNTTLNRNRIIFLGDFISSGRDPNGETEIKISDEEYDLIASLIGSKSEVMDIRKFENDLIPIPKFSHPFNNDKMNIFIGELNSKCEPRFTDLISKILINTKYVSFFEFMQNFKSSLSDFELKLLNYSENKSYILHIPNPTKHINEITEKSNYWISQIAYHLLNIKPSLISFSEDDLKNKLIYLSKIKQEYINILLCDDGIYSGKQMSAVISKVIMSFFNFQNSEKLKNIKLMIHIICPYITNYALDNFDKFNNTKIYYQKIIKMTKEIMSEDDIKYINSHNILVSPNSSPIYMEHKMPDFMSSIPDLYGSSNLTEDRDITCKNKVDYRLKYIIENCSFLEETKNEVCPHPIYKNEYRNERNPASQKSYNLTPEQFIEIFKSNFHQIKNNNDIFAFAQNIISKNFEKIEK
jgi:hypothetical protein